MSVVKLMCEIYHMCMFSNNYIVVMCVNNANVCILDGVSTIVSTSVCHTPPTAETPRQPAAAD